MRTANQRAFTLIAPIHRGRVAELRSLLSRDTSVAGGATVRPDLAAVEEIPTLHQARFVVVDEARDPRNEPVPGCLIFSAHYDGAPSSFEHLLIETGEKALARLFECCVGFDEEEGSEGLRVERYSRKHALDANAFFVGARGRTVKSILEERDICGLLRERLDAIADSERPSDPLLLRRLLRDHVESRMQEAGRVFEPRVGTEAPGRVDRFAYALRLSRHGLLALASVIAILAFPPVGIVVAIALPFLFAALRVDEEKHADALARAEAAESDSVAARDELNRMRASEASEDLGPQNELTALAWVRPSRLRRVLLRAVLGAVDLRASYWFTGGLLHGVPTIHFAHWLVFDRGRRLLFVSHYDGSFASYLDDFVAHAAKALTAIWGGCAGFPPARYLFFDGATDGGRFKAFARASQVAASWFYSAYPNLSTAEINRNGRISDGLFEPGMGRDEARAWLSLL